MSDITLTPRERALIRNEFMVRFGQAPRLESGILVKRWATGPNKGQLKPGTVIRKRYERTLLPEVSSVAEIARGFTGDGGHDGRRRQASSQT